MTHGLQFFMQVQVVVSGIDHAAGDIGAMVGGAFQIGKQVAPDEAHADAAFALLHALDVAVAQLVAHFVDYLFQGFHIHGHYQVIVHKSLEAVVQNFFHGGGEGGKFPGSLFRHGQLLFPHFFCGFQDIHGMVGNAFEITDHFEEFGGLFTVGLAHAFSAELDEEGAQHVFIMVRQIFISPNAFGQLGGGVIQRTQGIFESTDGYFRHFPDHVAALLQGNRGSGQQTVVQFHLLFGGLGIGNKAAYQLFQGTGEGQQHAGGDYLEGSVHNSHAHEGSRCIQHCRLEHTPHHPVNGQQNDGSDDIEEQMGHGGALGFLLGADGGKHGGNAGADAGTHDHGDGGAVGDGAGNGESLNDTHGSGGGLDDAGEDSAGQQAQNRVLEQQEQALEAFIVLQHLYGPGHGFHTHHQRGKAQQNGAGILFLVALAEHVENKPDQRQHRRPGGGLEQLHHNIAVADACQGHDPAGDGGAYVGTDDHVNGLFEGHHAGVDKAYDHDGGGGRGLDHSRYAKAGEEAGQLVFRQLAQQCAKAAAGTAFQAVAHYAHTKQEQAQAAYHRQCTEKVKLSSHGLSPYPFPIFLYLPEVDVKFSGILHMQCNMNIVKK